MRKSIYFLTALVIFTFTLVYFGWDLKLPWIDIPLHFLGGFFVALFFSDFLKEYFPGKNKFKNTVILIGVAVLIGTLWEFAEFAAGRIFTVYTLSGERIYFIGDLVDTLGDLLMDIIGGGIFSLLHFFRGRETHQGKARF